MLIYIIKVIQHKILRGSFVVSIVFHFPKNPLSVIKRYLKKVINIENNIPLTFFCAYTHDNNNNYYYYLIQDLIS